MTKKCLSFPEWDVVHKFNVKKDPIPDFTKLHSFCKEKFGYMNIDRWYWTHSENDIDFYIRYEDDAMIFKIITGLNYERR
jgi:hypothetical protein